MDYRPQFNMAMDALGQLGVDIRVEPLTDGTGGLCRLRARDVVFLDSRATDEVNYGVCVQALALIPAADAIYMPPLLRDDVERARRESGGAW